MLRLGFLVLVILAFFRVYGRSETIRIGYQLGALKAKEAQLLQQKSSLKMELSQISTKKSLEKLIKEKSVSLAYENESH